VLVLVYSPQTGVRVLIFECQVVVRVAYIVYDPTVKKSSNRLDKAAIKARKEESAALQTQKKSSDLVGATLVAVMPLGPVGAATLGFNSMTIYFQWASSIPTWVGDCR